MFLIVLIRNHLFVRARGHFIQPIGPIGPIVSALVFPRFASFSSSSIAFLVGKKGKKFERLSPHYILKVYISHICDSGKGTAFKA